MPIFHITYMSNEYRVKGYLGIPEQFQINMSDLSLFMNKYYNSTIKLPIERLTDSLVEKTENILFQKLPALIYCRGGIGKVGRVKTEWIQQFINFGYVVFAPSYRGNEGGEGRDEFGGADREDVHSVFRFLQSLPFVQKDHISILGFSCGSINATLTAIQQTEIYRLILWGGVTGLAKTYEERIDLRRMLKRVIGGTPNKVPSKYMERSPISLIKHIHCPVLIIHGTSDIQVHVSHALTLYEVLQNQRSKVELHCYHLLGHHLPPVIHLAVLERMFEWLECK